MLKPLLLLGFSNIASFVFVTACTSYLLAFVLKVEDNSRGSTLGYLETADQIVSLIGCPLWGLSSDTVGERAICIAGLLLMAFGLILHPISKYSIPENITELPRSLLLARVLFSFGGSATITMLTAYTAHVSKDIPATRISSYLGIGSGFGAMFAAFFLLRLPSILNNYIGPWSLLATFGLLIFILLCTALAVALTFPPRSERYSEPTDEAPKKLTLAAALSGCVARINSVSPHLFVPLWIAGFCRSYLPNENTAIITKQVSSALLGTCQLAVLITAPLIGIYAKKIKTDLGLLFITSIGALAYAILYVIDVPNSAAGYAILSVIGVAEIGTIILSLSLFISSYGSSRGKRSGIYGVAGSMGIIYISNIGGYLSDLYGRRAPFLLIGYSNLAFAIIGAYSLIYDR